MHTFVIVYILFSIVGLFTTRVTSMLTWVLNAYPISRFTIPAIQFVIALTLIHLNWMGTAALMILLMLLQEIKTWRILGYHFDIN